MTGDLRLDTGWTFASCEADSALTPEAAQTLFFRPAAVPGTVAAALIAFEDWDWSTPPALDALDVWYRTRIRGAGCYRLDCDGLATFADIYLDDTLVARSASMFAPLFCELALAGDHVLSIRFRALAPALAGKKGRARWRPRMIQPGQLRFARTSALGHMPGFAPPAPPVGPWRDMRLRPCTAPLLISCQVRARLDGADGELSLDLVFDRPPLSPPRARCEGADFDISAASPEHYVGRLRIAKPQLWFAHTHGAPRLYDIEVLCGADKRLLRTGFRQFAVERGADGLGFSLSLNGVPVFCRGAVWTPLDPVSLQNDPAALARQIALAKAAGVNMFRVSGPFVYETATFHSACDEAGIMVWQDFMFSNFDYPLQESEFVADVAREARALLERTSGSPSLVVLCGGSEVYQQAAMLGLPEDKWRSPLFEEILPDLARALRKDVVYVDNSPSGGALPFQVDAGISHYYGVGAYRRDLDDARRADVRFASECLGFANVPETHTLEADFGAAPLSSPLWRSRIPRDQGAMQDFEDVRDHYVGLLYGVDPSALKEAEPERYLDLSRAAVAETIEATIGEWRRNGGRNGGALIWFWKDLWASSGWGVIDWRGRPKSPWYAARRAFRPVQIVLTDEGVNGLHIHCVNERAEPFEGCIQLACYKDGATIVMRATYDVSLKPRETKTIRDCEIWGAFFDTAYSYRFGPPSHEATVATLTDAQGAHVAQAWHFPLGRAAAMFAADLRAEAFCDAEGYGLRLSSDRIAQSVKIEDRAAIPLDNWLHLAPGCEHVVRFLDAEAPIEGRVAALGRPPLFYRV